MKKILFISDNDGAPWGGSEELWSQTASVLAPHYKISALVKKWDSIPEAITFLNQTNVNVFFRDEKKVKQRSFVSKLCSKLFRNANKPSQNPFYTISNLEFFDLAIISACDSVNRKLTSYTAVLSAKKIPYVFLVQLATDLRMVPDSLASQLKESYEQAECVYFLSPENAQKTQLMLGCVLPNIKYVNNPFNFNQELVGFEGDEANYSLACVAALKSFHKGQDILLSVLGQDKWKARNICLNFYGEGVNREQLKRLVQIYGLEDKVSFLGFESNKHAIWAHNMGCIMPSRMEGQSLAMLEAMSFGRMVISTKVGDAERLIEHGKTGFLVDFPSFEVLDRVMDEAWNLRDQWLSMGKYSRQKLFKEIPINPIEFFADCIKTHL